MLYPGYGEIITETAWNGLESLAATTGDQIMIIECVKSGKALKAGVATVTAKA